MIKAKKDLELIQQTLAIGSDGGLVDSLMKCEYANEVGQEKAFWFRANTSCKAPLASARGISCSCNTAHFGVQGGATRKVGIESRSRHDWENQILKGRCQSETR